ncbi:MAG: S-layer protein domain-containing protein [Euryarchaeota archaeon]|nr:S-layer protein domain-containing protein [Euryarchaeota archaeon]
MVLRKKLLQVDAFMRVPNKYGKKNRKKINFLPTLFFSATTFFLFSIIVSCAVFPAAGADDKKLSIILIDGDEIYVRSGNYYTFLQDYQLHVKGANSEGSRVWIELRRNNVSLEDAIVSEGDTFVYSNNSNEILNITVETIYGGANGALVKFSPVYQYLNPKLPKPQTPATSPSNSSNNNSSAPHIFENRAEGFDQPIFFLSIGAVLLITVIFVGIYRKKRFKKRSLKEINNREQ